MPLVIWTGRKRLALHTRPGVPYYVSTTGSGGDGSFGNPWGPADLVTVSPVGPGTALQALRSGDTLYFRAGTYHFSGDSIGFNSQIMSPTHSGNPLNPITLRSYPGESVTLVRDSGVQPIFGTSIPAVDYCRFLGFTIQDARPLTGTGDALTYFSGTGNEIAYCEIIGEYQNTGDNHDGIVFHDAISCWCHHNNVYGLTGDGDANASSIKIYKSQLLVVEDCYCHDSFGGIFDKDGGTFTAGTQQNTYRRNWISGSQGGFIGNNQNSPETIYVHDNVIDGGVDYNNYNQDCEYHNNLLRPTYQSAGTGRDLTQYCGGSPGTAYTLNFWDNIVLDSGANLWAVYNPHLAWTTGLSTSPIAYMNCNVYDGVPQYGFSGSSFTLAQFQVLGFETNSAQDAAANIFVDQIAYVLKPTYQGSGRYGDDYGPRGSQGATVAQILDTSRYGPAAIGSYA